MGTFRTPEMTQKYADYRAAGHLDNGCRLCDVPAIKQYKFWKIAEAKFSFDRVAVKHNMLLPLRHTVETGLTEEEKQELLDIKNGDIQTEYEFIIEATTKKKSIPSHFHLHLIVAQD